MAARSTTNRWVHHAIALAALVGMAGLAHGLSTTPNGDILWEDAVTLGGGNVQTAGGAYASTNSGAVVSGHVNTVSGFRGFWGPNLEPAAAPPASTTSGWSLYE